MAYEIDIVGAGKDIKMNGDAIAFRWKDSSNRYKVAVYDGGVDVQGEILQQHLENYYFKPGEERVVDCVICSHSDLDHASGLKHILENFTVRALYMNRPWLYVDDVWEKVNDGRITKDSLVEKLKDEFKYIADLESIALEKGIPIHKAFQGTVIEEKLTILSPSREFYLQLLVESEKTPLEDRGSKGILTDSMHRIMDRARDVLETWWKELLRENVATTPENEMSIVIYGALDENILLTADVGIRGLKESIDYAEVIGKTIKDTVNFLQIPHHGGRHNVSPSILDQLVGEKVGDGHIIGKVAVASVAKDSDHPLQMVVNAFTRRGVKVYKNDGGFLCHHIGIPSRAGWGPVTVIGFNDIVEEWDD